ncbi:MAG: acetoacetate--CoA ligase [Pseudomonadota bacterium]
MAEILWRPPAAACEAANISRFKADAAARYGLELNDFWALHQWSCDAREAFWSMVWEWCEVVGDRVTDRVLADDAMPGARWFPDARLNFAENLLVRRDDKLACVFQGEDRVRRELSYAELSALVARIAAALKAAGVEPGDRVAGYLPNMPETIAAMLAAASIGATWSSCSPDFGVQGVVDRFGQIEPVVLFATDGYFYNGKQLDSVAKLREICAAIPSIRTTVLVEYTGNAADAASIPGLVTLSAFTARYTDAPLEFVRLPFDHPLYIMYSSGTTGQPKCIVHGAGGTLLKHAVEHRLHADVRTDDRLFYFTTCGWMMWNWLVSGLATGTTVLLYDGSPFYPGPEVLFDFADREGMTIFGTSAKFVDAVKKSGLRPAETHQLAGLRAMLSTGSPLVPESFDFVYQHIKRDLHLASISGGTDIIGCFVGGVPTLPVRRGEIQAPILGMQSEVFDDDGTRVVGRKGELVCTRAFPSMPIYFWNDTDGSRYRAAYFERFPGIWCHGDYVEESADGGMLIHGRSDAVLNPGGVRIGTAEIYRQVEQLAEVEEGLVIGQQWEGDVRVVLFVRLAAGASLDAELQSLIRTQIRTNATPRHVPSRIVEVSDIPRTKSGKIVELAVRNVVHGEPVKNVEALANPEALKQFADRVELRD